MSNVVVIGAGHNGLIAAMQLARAGHGVTVVERSSVVGGLCAPIEFAPGYTLPGVLHDTAFTPELAKSLGLALEFDNAQAEWVRDGDGFRELHRDLRDVEGAGAWRAFRDRVRGFAQNVLSKPPPPILPTTTSDFWKLGKTGLGLRRLGRADMIELMRVPPMCAADWINEHFKADPALAEWIAYPAVLGAYFGPWSAGTAANLLLADMLRGPQINGGAAALAAALEHAAGAAGVKIELNTTVRRITIESGRATGVETADGQTHAADAVVATCDPRTTFLDLIEPVQLPKKIERQFLSIRSRGTTAKLMLALDGPLELEGAGAVERAYIGGGSLDGLERAFDAVKYGEFAQNPVLDISVPTAPPPRNRHSMLPSVGGSLAPDGHHVVSILASFAPYDLRAGWTDETRAAFQERILTRLAECAPTVRDRIVASELWTPVDLEREVGITGGCLQHVEHALDQLLFMRPTASAANYETPFAGLYLGGSGSHPCGGITGLPGLLCSQAVRF
jgi:phytoene dehydrogenase-like protein